MGQAGRFSPGIGLERHGRLLPGYPDRATATVGADGGTDVDLGLIQRF